MGLSDRVQKFVINQDMFAKKLVQLDFIFVILQDGISLDGIGVNVVSLNTLGIEFLEFRVLL